MIFTVDAHVATIRLDRPQEHNRIEPSDLDALAGHIAVVNDNRDIRVLVLASTGKTFSSGFHLGAIEAGAPQRFEEVANALAACRVPSIAAIQGSVYGGAADLALACDFRIGVDGIELMVPAVRLGIPYYPGAIERFINLVTPNAAKRILLACERLDAQELLDCGYLDQIVARETLDARVAELAANLASLAPLAAQAVKAQLNRFDRAAAAEAVRACLASQDHKEGLAAWIEKRTARFTGA
ncbi:MAG TPA: enoyl-CoA hydratase/isomerase family protein [Bryobacteraceae bacterium]|nr:enoyl-CoA hydratase/isomerase family protein [Bryobacteraceae bacterium]